MTKHRSLNGVILSVILMSLFWLTPTITVKAITNPSSSGAPTDCTEANLETLKNYFHIKYDWNDTGTTITFQSSHGEFRFVTLDTKFFTNSFSKDTDGFYKIDGGNGVVSSTKKVKLHIKDSARGGSATVKLALSKSSGACDSLVDFKLKKAAGQHTETFDTGNFEIVIPFSSKDQSKFKQDNSHNYNGVCKALREGTNHQGKINSDILKLYDGSTNAKSYYSVIAPSCFQTSAVYVYTEARMIKIIETALSTWATYNQLKNDNKIGFGDTDVTGDQWLIDFNKVMNAANAAGNSYYADGLGNFYSKAGGSVVKSKDQSFDMKCRITANSSTDYSNLLQYKADGSYNIDANVKNYYAYDESKQSITYKWYTHWKGVNNSKPKVETVTDFCSKKCEEAVEVKYGPPIASKAGLCFEYQVQVTSRVRCSTSMEGKPPMPNPPFCVPIPYCNDIPGHTHQAGATDEYKACVNSCDGGKYTEKCSEKCYSKVYEGKSNKTSSNVDTANAEKLYSRTYSYNGYHYFSGSKIRWSADTYANYYYYFERSRTYGDHITHGGHYVPESGYKKRLYDTGTCKDPCFFAGCSKSDYVNKSDFMDDYMDNLSEYSSKIKECKASASCTTKTATFKISADYKNAKGVIKTVDYPYTTSVEDLISDENKTKCAPNDTVTSKEDNIILAYAGCYKKCGKGLQYHTRWSFPGTWLNKKTGAISFKKPTNADGWQNQKEKFCIPLDAQDVNVKWWKYYYGYYNSNHTTSFNEEYVQSNCVTVLPHSTISEDDIESWSVGDGIKRWNINAKTKTFGYYGWSFDISCFYALNSSQTETVANDTTKVENCSTPNSSENISYRIRTVDLENMFPDAKSATGTRAPGFNWSKHANISAENGKNKEYESAPSVYAEKVQSMGYNVYDESNIDYEFYLTKSILQKLKAENKNYSDFKGEMITSHGMNSYKSNLIRSGIFNDPENKILSESAIGCNNVKDRSTCDLSAHGKEE